VRGVMGSGGGPHQVVGRRGQGARAVRRSRQGEGILREADGHGGLGGHRAARDQGGQGVPVIASARMYSWSPSLAWAWHRLLAWLGKTAGADLALMDQSDPTPL